MDTEDPRQIRCQVGRGTKPAVDVAFFSSLLDRVGHHMLESDSQPKTVLWHMLIVGHEWRGKGVAGEVPREIFIAPERFDLRDSSLFWMNELAIIQGGTTQTSRVGSGAQLWVSYHQITHVEKLRCWL